MKNNHNIVLNAVKKNTDALQFASENIRNNYNMLKVT